MKCKECGQPLLRAGKVRKNPDEYRHASGCPLDDYPDTRTKGTDNRTVEQLEAEVIGQRGMIVGDHPWAGNTGKIVRCEKTLVGYGLVVRLDDGPDVPDGQECFVFEPKYWRRIAPPSPPRTLQNQKHPKGRA